MIMQYTIQHFIIVSKQERFRGRQANNKKSKKKIFMTLQKIQDDISTNDFNHSKNDYLLRDSNLQPLGLQSGARIITPPSYNYTILFIKTRLRINSLFNAFLVQGKHSSIAVILGHPENRDRECSFDVVNFDGKLCILYILEV